MYALNKQQQLADLDSIIDWARNTHFSVFQIDCIITLMLKILDEKCKMDAQHQQVIRDLYSVVNDQQSALFDQQIHQLIERVEPESNILDAGFIHELRKYAESEIPKVQMKRFKQFLWDVVYI